MSKAKSLIALLAAAVGLSLASSAVPGTRPEVQDWDCPPAPAPGARPVAVAGYPVSFLSDRNGLSPTGRADLTGALLGLDRFRPGAFAANVAVYAAAGAGVAALATCLRRSAA